MAHISAEPQGERVPIRTALDELSHRLESVRHRLDCVRKDVLGHEVAKVPASIAAHSLEDKVFALYEPLQIIEDAVAKLIIRLGVDDSLSKQSAEPPIQGRCAR